jgi:cell division transport system permease protein
VTERRRGRVRTAVVVVANTIRILLLDPFASWRRDFRYFGPALASICLALVAGGLIGIVAFSAYELLQAQVSDVSVLTIYLSDSADQPSVDRFSAQLQGDPRVTSVTYISKDQALAQARRRPDLVQLAGYADSNPFPASLVVQVGQLQDVGAIDALARQSSVVDPQIPTSYDADAYNRIQLVLRGVLIGGGALLLIGGIVAVAFTSTAIRGVIGARRDELRVMRLIGTPAWMVRGPFVVEGALTGIVGGLLAGVSVGGLCLVAVEKGQALYVQWLPGLSPETAVTTLAALVVAGFVVGASASAFELRKVN